MRIDGTEAVVFSTPKINSSDISANVNNNHRSVASEVKAKATDHSIPSNLNEFERNVLPVSEQVVMDALEKVNRSLAGSSRRFDISIHEKTNEIMVKVIDSETDKVIREIPSEKILDMVAKLWELAGLIVDERR